MNRYGTILISVLLAAAGWTVSCDDGRIYPDGTEVEREGGSVRMTGRIDGQGTWAAGYAIVVAGFSEDSEYAKTAKGLATGEDGLMDIVLSGIPGGVTTVEICAIDKLRKRIVSFYTYDYAEQEDTIRIDVGAIDIGMYAAVQTNIFDRTCISCHGESTSAAGLCLVADSSYAALVGIPASLSPDGMNLVTPGNADSSFLHRVLNTDISADWRMDHIDMVTSNDLLKLIDDWIENGARK